MRTKLAIKNAISGFLYQIVNMICGFVLPRLILSTFGSDYNGLVMSVTQFLDVAVLFQAGMGLVTEAALFKPLVDKDTYKISVVIMTSEKFLRKAGLIFLVSTIVISICNTYLRAGEFDMTFTFFLCIAMSFGTYAQYFLVQSYTFLLRADQRQNVIYILNSLKIIASTLIAYILIRTGSGLIAVKAMSSLVFLIAPLAIYMVVTREYRIDKKVKTDFSVISQRWDNFAQQVAFFIQTNSDLIILSVFSNAFEMSVYAIYRLITGGVYCLFLPLINGFSAAFGNMFAKGENELIYKNIKVFETIVFTTASFLFGVCFTMLVPFVMIYTHGISDVKYDRPLFAYLIIIASILRCWRVPYEMLVRAVGHFKQMKMAAILETAINVGLSVILVIRFGLVGVVIGTIFALGFRIIWYAIYVSKNVISRNLSVFVKRLLVSIGSIIIVVVITTYIPLPVVSSYKSWIFNAVVTSVVSLTIVVGIELIFYKAEIITLIKKIRYTLA